MNCDEGLRRLKVDDDAVMSNYAKLADWFICNDVIMKIQFLNKKVYNIRDVASFSCCDGKHDMRSRRVNEFKNKKFQKIFDVDGISLGTLECGGTI